jgi:hypothetical protein
MHGNAVMQQEDDDKTLELSPKENHIKQINAVSFIEDIRNCVSNKKIILFFDRDDAGKKAVSEITHKDKNSKEIKNCEDYASDDALLKCSFYPYSSEVNSGDFCVEDYFSEALIENIITDLINTKKHPIKEVANLPKRIKETLANKYHDYSKLEYEGFKPLLNKLLELLGIQ